MFISPIKQYLICSNLNHILSLWHGFHNQFVNIAAAYLVIGKGSGCGQLSM